MLLEICVISYGLYTGDSLYRKIRERMRKGGVRRRTNQPATERGRQHPVAKQENAYSVARFSCILSSWIRIYNSHRYVGFNFGGDTEGVLFRRHFFTW
jgi:hypothetical protein